MFATANRFARAIGVGVLALTVITAAAQPPPEARPAPPALQPRPTPEPIPVRFEATVYRVALAPERIVALDAAELARQATTPAALLKVLQGLGETEVLYRLDQLVDLRESGRISVERNAAYTVTVAAPPGQPGRVTQTDRGETGAKFALRARPLDAAEGTRFQVGVEVGLAVRTRTAPAADENPSSPVFWTVDQSYGGPLRYGEPIVLVSADGTPASTSEPALAFVTLLKFGGEYPRTPPQPARAQP